MVVVGITIHNITRLIPYANTLFHIIRLYYLYTKYFFHITPVFQIKPFM